uniref:EF-hand domain-containing protein n=1 Tax=Eutreptiella gymnastica TaxID=73025 RepID=A0A7S1HX88_9EUGL|mmetsp:Transcript_111808/g.194062  ORF Transcript_111808/g.194062 Transcript_111808/m.194062 type:complete len:695 (+) Transcript_111808:126-2210(+)
MDASGHSDEEQWMHTTLEMEGQRVGASRAQVIAEGLCKTSAVRYLGLSRAALSDEGVRIVMQGMKLNRTVEILDLSANEIKDAGALHIAEMLECNSTLQSIVLTRNKIRKTGGAAIAQALLRNRRLVKLNLSGNRLRDGGAFALADTLCHNAILEQLDLSKNEINEPGAKALAKALMTNDTLQALRLASNLVGAAFVDFAPMLTMNHALMEVDVENNMITSSHAKEFGHNLLQVSLMTFNLSNNALRDDGLKPILDSFKERSVLRYLDIANTEITAKSMDELAYLLGVCPDLETLQVDGNTIGFEGINLLAGTIKENQSLTSLSVSRCGLDSTSTIALALALHNNPLFTSLTVSSNRIGDEGCRSLCFALKRMTLLRSVDMSGNAITEELKEELASVFVNNPKLDLIELQGNPIAPTLVNGVMSRRIAQQLLDLMDNNSKVLAAPTPLSVVKRPSPMLPLVRAGSPSVLKSAAHSFAVEEAVPSTNSLLQLALSSDPPDLLVPADDYHRHLLDDHQALMKEEKERLQAAYAPLLLPKSSLENPYYVGFGKGRFSNGCLVQVPGEVTPYTVANSMGTIPARKWSDRMSTSEALFAKPLRRPHRPQPYSERQLEVNPSGLLVTERQLRDAFNELDVDNNGWLDETEFLQLYQTFENFGVKTTERQVNDFLKKYKVMDDGKLTFDEFSCMMLSVGQR